MSICPHLLAQAGTPREEQGTQDHVQQLVNNSGRTVSSTDVLPDVQGEPLPASLCPLPLLVTRRHWEEPGSALLALSLQASTDIDRIME